MKKAVHLLLLVALACMAHPAGAVSGEPPDCVKRADMQLPCPEVYAAHFMQDPGYMFIDGLLTIPMFGDFLDQCRTYHDGICNSCHRLGGLAILDTKAYPNRQVTDSTYLFDFLRNRIDIKGIGTGNPF